MLAQTDVCSECKLHKRAMVQLYVDKIIEFGEDNYLDRREEEELRQLKRRLGLTDKDLKVAERRLENLRRLTKQAKIKKYEDKLREVGADGYLDSNEEAELDQLVKRFKLTKKEISHTIADLINLKKLTAIQDGNLTVINADINLMKNETCYYEIPAELTEAKPLAEEVKISIKITKDLSYQVGGLKEKKIIGALEKVVDRGTLYLTNKRVIFVGGKVNATYSLSKIVRINKFPNAIQFLKDKENKPKCFILKDGFAAEEIIMIFFKLVSQRRGWNYV